MNNNNHLDGFIYEEYYDKWKDGIFKQNEDISVNSYSMMISMIATTTKKKKDIVTAEIHTY